MLAATSEENNKLKFIKQALLIAKMDSGNVPIQIQGYFDTVLQQAKLILADSSKMNARILSEAIDLALEMRRYEDLAQEMKTINSINDLSAERVSSLLGSMEEHKSASQI
ncbi:hypothetical protein [uncultured Methylophaga sp.]|uniref:hypothetical protein n=1 Tax=uncultured Methylophaga sp. TaxID=285271 RepID=UPI0030FB5195